MDVKHNILYIEGSDVYGGSAQSLYDILNYLDKTKFNPIVFYRIDAQSFFRLKQSNYEILLLKTPFLYYCRFLKNSISKHPYKYLKKILTRFSKGIEIVLDRIPALLILFVFIKKRKIGLVHLNNQPYYYPGIIAASIAGIPCISHIRGYGKLSIFTKGFSKFIKIFIPVSSAIKQHYKKMGISGEKQIVIYDGVKECSLANCRQDNNIKHEFNIQDGNYVIGHVGRIVWHKGQSYLLEAAPQILERIPNAYFIFVGGINADVKEDLLYKVKLDVLLKKLHLGEKVIFTGYRSDTRKIFTCFDLFVFPSLMEAGGVALLEAMSAGLPIVTVNEGGPAEIIEDGVSGLLVPPRDSTAIAKAVIRIFKHKKFGRFLSHNATLRVQKEFCVKKMVKSIEEIYDRFV